MLKRLVFAVLSILLILVAIVALRGTASAPLSKLTGKVPISQSPKPAFNKSTHSTTDPTSIWVVVNKQHSLAPLNYTPSDLAPVGNGQFMRAEAAGALAGMLAAAKAAGYVVTPDSAYRSYDTQVAVYDNEVRANGQAVADSESARPGYSEHQTGWAVDLGSGGCNIADCFATTPGGQWVTANAYRYGFILRYQTELTDITGYRAETWHFRYVGTLLAAELHKENVLTLEQFFGITGGTQYR